MKVIRKQMNSYDCIVCGINNEMGLKAPFYEMEDSTVVSLFSFKKEHQSYPNRVHGGMITTMLDEIIGRALWIFEPNTYGVTMDLHIKYRKPVPYDCMLKAVGKITRNNNRLFEGTAKLQDMDGNILASAEAIYFKLSLDKISCDLTHDELNVFVSDQVKEIK